MLCYIKYYCERNFLEIFFLILVNETRISLVDLVEGHEYDIRNRIRLHWTSILNTKTLNGSKQTSAVLYYHLI